MPRRFLVGAAVWLALLLGAATPAAALPPAVAVAVLNGLDPDYQAAVNRMTVRPPGPYLRAGSAFVRRQKQDGLWATIDYEAGFCGALHDAQAARVNLKTPTLIGTEIGSPTFTPGAGYPFDGVDDSVNTGWIASTMAVNAQADSMTALVYVRSNQNVSGAAFGSRISTSNRWMFRPRSSAAVGGGFNSTFVAGAASVTDARGLSGLTRLGGVYSFIKDGAVLETASPTPAAVLSNVALFIGSENAGGSVTGPLAYTWGGLVVASGWAAAQHVLFNAAARECMTAVGAQAP